MERPRLIPRRLTLLIPSVPFMGPLYRIYNASSWSPRTGLRKGGRRSRGSAGRRMGVVSFRLSSSARSRAKSSPARRRWQSFLGSWRFSLQFFATGCVWWSEAGRQLWPQGRTWCRPAVLGSSSSRSRYSGSSPGGSRITTKALPTPLSDFFRQRSFVPSNTQAYVSRKSGGRAVPVVCRICGE